MSKGQTAPKYDLYRDGVTQSMLTNWLECRQKARLHLQGWTSIRPSTPLTFGTIVHALLDKAYQEVAKRKALPNAKQFRQHLADIEKQWHAENPGADPGTLQTLELALAFTEAVMPVYFEYWERDVKEMQWTEIEGEFAIPLDVGLKKPVLLRGKRDGMFRGKRGLWLFETKTKSRFDEGFLADTLTLNFQTNVYCYSALIQHGEVPRGVVYNIIRRPQLQQRKTESLQQFAQRCADDVKVRPEFYFSRLELATDETDIKRFQPWLLDIVREFGMWCEGTVPHYPNTNACENKYGACHFVAICAHGDNRGFRKRERIFAELAEKGT